MRLSYIKTFATIAMTMFLVVGYSQQQEIEALEALGLENIRVVKDGSQSYVSFQDDVYRGVKRGISEVMNALNEVDATQTYNLLLEEDGVPVVAVTSSPNSGLTASYNTAPFVEKLKATKRYNNSLGKIDFVLYPELYLVNSWLDKLYGVAVNISPAVELSLWPGAMATAQLVIPIYTNMLDEKQYIRPGVITFRQDVRVTNQLYGTFSIGNFTNDRIGVDAELNYYTKNGGWNFGARAGLTGSSTFYGGEWLVGEWRRVTWSGWASYYEPTCNIVIKGEIVQMIYEDRGVRGSVQRYFNDVSIGFYAMLTGGYPNGGFTFSSPLPFKSRPKRNKMVSITYPEYFTRVYRARNAIAAQKGFSYNTRPDAGSLGNFYNPRYIEAYNNK